MRREKKYPEAEPQNYQDYLMDDGTEPDAGLDTESMEFSLEEIGFYMMCIGNLIII